jgi:phosphoribosylformylglycinamidine synthase subunit PurQ / glutaminase
VKVAIIRFPGANCDQDAFHALNDDMGIAAEYVWHEEKSLKGYEGAFIPGGFSYGDYLRCGAMAARAPIMEEVKRFAQEGRPVIGACNGFQVLCEAGLLPGALLLNESQKFLCKNVYLQAVNRKSIWTRDVDKIVEIPIAHGEGRYACDDDTLKLLQDNDLIAFRYVSPAGDLEADYNANGSIDHIAGVLNRRGNVLGLMPHPERATKPLLGSTDGKLILNAFTKVAVAL